MLLKEVYNHEFLQNLSNTILKFDKKFDEKEFLKIAKGKTWEDKSLKERMRAITQGYGTQPSASFRCSR